MGIENRELLKVHDIKSLLRGENLAALQAAVVPRMTTTARDALTASSKPYARFTGMQIYNTTTNKINFFNGTAWEVVTSA
jgi:hypothetical protein